MVTETVNLNINVQGGGQATQTTESLNMGMVNLASAFSLLQKLQDWFLKNLVLIPIIDVDPFFNKTSFSSAAFDIPGGLEFLVCPCNGVNGNIKL